MKYIWINPVTDGMYERHVLEQMLNRHGYKRVEVSEDWLLVVRKKYENIVKKTDKPVVDVRCPMAAELVKKLVDESAYEFPEIWPILLHCGYEIAKKEELQGKEIIITTPCLALADQGNTLGYRNVRFVPWNLFLEELNETPEIAFKKETPIPLGFFEELGVDIMSLTGEKEIRNYFQNHKEQLPALIEMLYCHNGCHNGDGIIQKES